MAIHHRCQFTLKPKVDGNTVVDLLSPTQTVVELTAVVGKIEKQQILILILFNLY